MPGFSALHMRQRNLPAIVKRSVSRVGPGHAIQQIAHDLPVREERLNRGRIGDFQRTEDQTFGRAFRDHAQIVPTLNM